MGSHGVTNHSAVDESDRPRYEAGVLDSEKPVKAINVVERRASGSTQGSWKSSTGWITTVRRWAQYIWLLELSACVFSIACMVAIAVVLLYEDGKALDQWALFIAPNAIVSFIAALAKSSSALAIAEVLSQYKWLSFHDGPKALSDIQLFDRASRGPAGAFQLLLRKRRHAIAVYGAALVVLVSLLVDPFIQLVFSFPSLEVRADTAALFDISNVYDPMDDIWATSNIMDFDIDPVVGIQMQAAILEGFYAQPAAIKASCPAGNCRWRDVTTLGVCAACTDVTSHTQTNCNSTGTDSWHPTGCDYTFPSGSKLQASNINFERSYGKGSTTWNATARAPIYWHRGQTALLLNIDAIQLPPQSKLTNSSAVTAWHCQMTFCRKTYASIITRNGTTESSIPDEQLLYIRGSNLAVVQDWPTRFFNTATANSDEIYVIDWVEASRISYYLGGLFTSGWWSGCDIATRSKPSYIPNISRNMAQSHNVTATLKQVAESMTQAVRIGRNSTVRHGESLVTKTFIKVRWAWLALPVLLTIATMVLLIVVILETNRKEIVAWKSSGLALLSHRLEDVDFTADEIRDSSGLLGVAKKTKVRLVDTGEFYAFVKHN